MTVFERTAPSVPCPDPEPSGGKTSGPPVTGPVLVNPYGAWKYLCSRTGGQVSLSTFYRWLQNGRVFSIRLGGKIFVPQRTLDELIERCLRGDAR